MSSTSAPTSERLSQPPAHDTPNPFVFRYGRRYLREASQYPLPVDLAELNRQNLRTLLLIQVFGAPFCCKLDKPPEKVLEIACGGGLWSFLCHEYLKNQGHNNVSFTGLDLAPLAPDLAKEGLNWRFVQHDLRQPPMPFEEGEFDLIFVNDGMVVFAANPLPPVNPLSALKKYLKPGGVVEIWESDFAFRCLLPGPYQAPGIAIEDTEQAQKTASYTISAATPFTRAQNKYLENYNQWIEAGFQKLGLSVAPCAVLGYGLSTEDSERVGNRRIAIPFSPIKWETQGEVKTAEDQFEMAQVNNQSHHSQDMIGRANSLVLTPEQLALRTTALNITVGLIESLEPLLKEESGMKQDEWDRWWSSIKTDLLGNDGTSSGECLEIAAAWVRK